MNMGLLSELPTSPARKPRARYGVGFGPSPTAGAMGRTPRSPASPGMSQNARYAESDSPQTHDENGFLLHPNVEVRKWHPNGLITYRPRRDADGHVWDFFHHTGESGENPYPTRHEIGQHLGVPSYDKDFHKKIMDAEETAENHLRGKPVSPQWLFQVTGGEHGEPPSQPDYRPEGAIPEDFFAMSRGQKPARYADELDPQEHAAFLEKINAEPWNALNHHVHADWLQERGHDQEAAFRRAMGDWFDTHRAEAMGPHGVMAGTLTKGDTHPQSAWIHNPHDPRQWRVPAPGGFGGAVLPVGVNRFDWHAPGFGPQAWSGSGEIVGPIQPHHAHWHGDAGTGHDETFSWAQYPHMEEAFRRSFMQNLQRQREQQPTQSARYADGPYNPEWQSVDNPQLSTGIETLNAEAKLRQLHADAAKQMQAHLDAALRSGVLETDPSVAEVRKHIQDRLLLARGGRQYAQYGPPNVPLGEAGASDERLQDMLRQFQSREHVHNRFGGERADYLIRGQLADALQDNGREEEAQLLRNPTQHAIVHNGRIVPARYTASHVQNAMRAADQALDSHGMVDPMYGSGYADWLRIRPHRDLPTSFHVTDTGPSHDGGVTNLGHSLSHAADVPSNAFMRYMQHVGRAKEALDMEDTPEDVSTALDNIRMAPFEEPIPQAPTTPDDVNHNQTRLSRFSRPGRPTLYSHEAFQNAIRGNPHDDTNWLVYADWLEENGRPDIAERMRWWAGAKAAMREGHHENLDPDTTSHGQVMGAIDQVGRWGNWVRDMAGPEASRHIHDAFPLNHAAEDAAEDARHAAQLHAMGLIPEQGWADRGYAANDRLRQHADLTGGHLREALHGHANAAIGTPHSMVANTITAATHAAGANNEGVTGIARALHGGRSHAITALNALNDYAERNNPPWLPTPTQPTRPEELPTNASRYARSSAEEPDTLEAFPDAVATDPQYIRPINPVIPEKSAALAENMTRNGWKGDPLLAVGNQALTGSHRLDAALHAGLMVPVIFLDSGEFLDAAKRAHMVKPDVRPQDAKFGDIDIPDDDGRLKIILKMNHPVAAKIMRDEIKHNDEFGGKEGWQHADWAAPAKTSYERGSVNYADPLDPQEHEAFMSKIRENPTDATNHLVLADWLQDRGHDDEAAFRRAMGQWMGEANHDLIPSEGFETREPYGDNSFTHSIYRSHLPGWAKEPHAPESASERFHDRTLRDPAIAYAPNDFWLHWRGYDHMEEGLRRAFMERLEHDRARQLR